MYQVFLYEKKTMRLLIPKTTKAYWKIQFNSES